MAAVPADLPETNVARTTPPPVSRVIEITSSAHGSSGQRRRPVFDFGPAPSPSTSRLPAFGPTAALERSMSSTSLVDNSDSEDLPDLPLPSTSRAAGATPTPSKNDVKVKLSDSQQKSTASRPDKGKGREVDAIDIDSSDGEAPHARDSDDDVIFVREQRASTPPHRRFPASQVIVNSTRRGGSSEADKPFSPQKREGRRRARPSAAHLRGKFHDAELSRASGSPAGFDNDLHLGSPQPKVERSSSAPKPSPEFQRSSPQRALAADGRRPGFEPLHELADDALVGLHVIKQTSQELDSADLSVAQPASGQISGTVNWQRMQDSAHPTVPPDEEEDEEEVDELADSGSSEVEDEDAIRQRVQHAICEESLQPDLMGRGPRRSPHVASLKAAGQDDASASPMPLTPPDIVVTPLPDALLNDAKANGQVKPGNSENTPSAEDTLHTSKEEQLRIRARCTPSLSSGGSAIGNSDDELSDTPIRRRLDVIYISHNASIKQKKQKNPQARCLRPDAVPDLLYSSADSAESGSRRCTPVPAPPLGKKTKKKTQTQVVKRPPDFRHRKAVIWTGREEPGMFREDQLVSLRNMASVDIYAAKRNQDRFTSFINEQIVREEPQAPHVQVLDPSGNYAFPPFDFIYTNRVLYRDGVPSPAQASGCGCIDGCQANNPKCSCAQKQRHWIARTAPNSEFRGFAYDDYGRLILPDDVPIIECNSNCQCPANCVNRQVSNGRTQHLDLIKTEKKGWGVQACAEKCSIRKGSFLCIYSGELITWQEAERRGQLNDDLLNPTSYLFDVDCSYMSKTLALFEETGIYMHGDTLPFVPPSSQESNEQTQQERYSIEKSLYTVDAMKYGNIGRFFNHACSPNAMLRAVICDDGDEFKPILAVFAKKKIYPGEEITISYRGFIDGGSEDGDSETDEEINEYPDFARTRKRKRSWRQQAPSRGRGKARGRGRGGKRGGGGGKRNACNKKQAGRANVQPAPQAQSVAEQQCYCGAINCDGLMFPRAESSDGDEVE